VTNTFVLPPWTDDTVYYLECRFH